MSSIFYDYNKPFSYNSYIHFIIGERGVGKTYGISKFCIKDFKKNKNRFVYIRRFQTELDKACPNFFTKLIKNNEFKNKFNVKSKDDVYNFFIDDENCGCAIPLSKAQQFKSVNFDNVTTIIFDEFIIEEGQGHYLKNEVTHFLGLIESISRLDDNVKIFMLSNAITQTNPYFLYFDINFNPNTKISTFKNNLIYLEITNSVAYKAEKAKSKLFKLTENTNFNKYAYSNNFLLDDNNFIEKKSQLAKFQFAFIYNNKTFGVWEDKKLRKNFC